MCPLSNQAIAAVAVDIPLARFACGPHLGRATLELGPTMSFLTATPRNTTTPWTPGSRVPNGPVRSLGCASSAVPIQDLLAEFAAAWSKR